MFTFTPQYVNCTFSLGHFHRPQNYEIVVGYFEHLSTPTKVKIIILETIRPEQLICGFPYEINKILCNAHLWERRT